MVSLHIHACTCVGCSALTSVIGPTLISPCSEFEDLVGTTSYRARASELSTALRDDCICSCMANCSSGIQLVASQPGDYRRTEQRTSSRLVSMFRRIVQSIPFEVRDMMYDWPCLELLPSTCSPKNVSLGPSKSEQVRPLRFGVNLQTIRMWGWC